jgi:hypothetical protein
MATNNGPIALRALIEGPTATTLDARGLFRMISPRQVIRLSCASKMLRDLVTDIYGDDGLPSEGAQLEFTKARFDTWEACIMLDDKVPAQHELVGVEELKNAVYSATRDQPVVVHYAAWCWERMQAAGAFHSSDLCFIHTPGADSVDGLEEGNISRRERMHELWEGQAEDTTTYWEIQEQHKMTVHVTLICKFDSQAEAVAAAAASATEAEARAAAVSGATAANAAEDAARQLMTMHAAPGAAAVASTSTGVMVPAEGGSRPPSRRKSVSGGSGCGGGGGRRGGSGGRGHTGPAPQTEDEYPVVWAHMCLDCRSCSYQMMQGLRWQTVTL